MLLLKKAHLTQNLPLIFEITPKLPDDFKKVLQSVLKDPAFPGWDTPHERLIFLQDQIETKYIKSGFKDLELNFREDSGRLLESLGRIQIYSEVGDPLLLKVALLNRVGMTKTQMAGLLAKKSIHEVINTITEPLENCVKVGGKWLKSVFLNLHLRHIALHDQFSFSGFADFFNTHTRRTF